MHLHQQDEKSAMSVRVMEKHFLKSPEGKPYVQEHSRIESEMASLRQRYDELWENAGPAFVEYLKKMGGMD